MEIVDKTAGSGSATTRELEWMLNMQRLDDQQEALRGLARRSTTARREGPSEVVGGARSYARGVGRLGAVRGSYPHPPFVDEVTIAARRAEPRLERIRRSRQPPDGAGQCAVLDAPLPRGPVLGALVPADFITESFRASSQLRSIMLASRPLRLAPHSGRSSDTRVFGEARWPMHPRSWGNAIE